MTGANIYSNGNVKVRMPDCHLMKTLKKVTQLFRFVLLALINDNSKFDTEKGHVDCYIHTWRYFQCNHPKSKLIEIQFFDRNRRKTI